MTDEGEGERPAFDVTRRGYRTSQVDAWVDRTTDRLETLERDLDDARQLARSLQASLDEARARSAGDSFGARAEKVLRLAEHDARLRRDRADREAEEIRELVHFEAERTVTEARAEAGRVREAAEQDADRMREAAEQDADRMRAEGEQDARLIRAEGERDARRVRTGAEQDAARTSEVAEQATREARAEVTAARRDADLCADTAASMHEHVRSVRSAVRDEIARLHATLGAELRSLDAPVPRPLAVPSPAGRTPAGTRSVDTGSLDAGSLDTGPPGTGSARSGTTPAADGEPEATAGGAPVTAGSTAGISTRSPGPDADTGAVARVVAMPEQRDRPPREEVPPPAIASGG